MRERTSDPTCCDDLCVLDEELFGYDRVQRFNTLTNFKWLLFVCFALMIIIAVISIASYLSDKGERTPLYKINKKVYIKPEK